MAARMRFLRVIAISSASRGVPPSAFSAVEVTQDSRDAG
ncbi:hypothetical protein STRIP9103_05376 [Streptomyces ipomoeae 91-03]|uniref:Uncharacterized protein n=1 Tax=Streptomyces ipomoeae 91-03 TaxID=698759 RepID=L1L2G4_9ACTN|nr:hypothetical protein STRIP9103_05376 [Streptomyces ipomoeae 91-03]